MTRRRMLQLGGLAALGLPLAACGIQGSSGSKLGLHAAYEQIDSYWARQKKTGTLDFANWPLYIDVGAKASDHPSLALFTKQTGIDVNYQEVIQQDDTFYGKIAPILNSGQGTGYDLMVITNGIYLDDLMQNDFLVPLDQTRMSNFYANASDLVKDASYDRGNVYTMAWQSGVTGIGYSRKLVGRTITSWNDLLDPKLAGKVGMFADNEDLPNAALLAVGANPETSEQPQWEKAAAWLRKQRSNVRQYYSQGYISALSSGDLWASQAWSGDIYQANLNGADLDFVVPDEGGLIWTDNMCIPAHAKHPLDAMTYMDWVYQPKIAAMIADYVAYITPVPATRQIFAHDGRTATTAKDRAAYRDLASSPLVYPTVSEQRRLHRYRVLSQKEQVTWNGLFEPIYES
ncbi:MAG: spermidine/putrescine ABC transporter substrate-binding protein [Jatrophihabitans endophyticus]|nr:spermidine/putrescine ABC transporter substrate-binding protein [Jatrophihabitans endophyticus]